MPPGLSLTNNVISGTIANNAASTTPYSVTVTATDASANVSASETTKFRVTDLVVDARTAALSLPLRSVSGL